MEPFYEHGSLADLVALCLAFEEWEKQDAAAFRSMRDHATLLEALLKALAVSLGKIPRD